MTKIVKKYEPTEQTKRIIELAQEAQGGATEARKRIKLSIDAAVKCGQLLIEERKQVIKEIGRGYWLSYYEINFAKVLPLRTAQYWMKLQCAIAYSRSSEPGNNGNGDLPESMPEDNITRLGMLALELFPKKTELITHGNVPAPKLTSHLAIIARLEEWILALHKRSNYEPMTTAQRDQLRADFHKVIEFCNELEAVRA